MVPDVVCVGLGSFFSGCVSCVLLAMREFNLLDMLDTPREMLVAKLGIFKRYTWADGA